MYMLSIEPVGEAAFLDGFHLGTDETYARQVVAERWHGRNDYAKELENRGRRLDSIKDEKGRCLWTQSCALMKHIGNWRLQIVAVYDESGWSDGYTGKWSAHAAHSPYIIE